MKKAIAIVLLGLGMAAALLATAEALEKSEQPVGDAVANTTPIGKAPKIAFEETEHDFGTIGKSTTVEHIFKFKNEGDAVLVIKEVKKTCGCTGTLLSDSEIPPDGEGSIQVTFKSGSSGGKKKKSIIVYSNDPQQPVAQLHIASLVIVPVELKPQSINWIAEQGKEQVRAANLTYQPDVNIKITELRSSSPAFTASYQLKESDEAPEYEIEIKYDGSLPMGKFSERLTILTDNPEHKELQLLLRGKVVGTIRIVPDAISLGVIKDDDTLPMRTLRVYSSNNEQFEITGVEVHSNRGEDSEANGEKPVDAIVSAEYEKQGDFNRYQLKVGLTEKPAPGAFSATLLVKTNVPGEESIEIPIYGHVR